MTAGVNSRVDAAPVLLRAEAAARYAESMFESVALTLAVEQQAADEVSSLAGDTPRWLVNLLGGGGARSPPLCLLHPSLRRLAGRIFSCGDARGLLLQREADTAFVNFRSALAGGSIAAWGDTSPRAMTPAAVVAASTDDAVAAVRLSVARGGVDMSRFAAVRGAIARDRVSVAKHLMPDAAAALFAAHSALPGSAAEMEIAFDNDKGIGIGVNREFYATLAAHLTDAHGVLNDGAATSNAALWHSVEPPDAPLDAASSAGHADTVVGGVDDTPDAAAAAPSSSRQLMHPEGLFPRPLSSSALANPQTTTAVRARFAMLGRALGKAWQEERILPLPLSPLLLAATQRLASRVGSPLATTLPRRESPSTGTSSSRGFAAAAAVLNDSLLPAILVSYYPAMRPFVDTARRVAAMRESRDAGASPDDSELRRSFVDGMLTFEAPGSGVDISSVALVDGETDAREADAPPLSRDTPVTIDNVDVYIAKLSAWVGWEGVQVQLSALVTGLRDALPDARWLGALSPTELRDLLCGPPRIDWDLASLQRAVTASHGYTSVADEPVAALLRVLVSMDQPQRAAFLRFATGQPVLPPGGLVALVPPLTVTRKADGAPFARRVPDAFSAALPSGTVPGPWDHLWVSASTCFHSVKLPSYSCEQLLREALREAIGQSAGLIDLS